MDALPGTQSDQEVHHIPAGNPREKRDAGSDKYCAEVNRRGKEIARQHGLKYVRVAVQQNMVLHDRPLKKHKVH